MKHGRQGNTNKRLFTVKLRGGVNLKLMASQVGTDWVVTHVGSDRVWSYLVRDDELEHFVGRFGETFEWKGDRWLPMNPKREEDSGVA